MTEQKKSVWSVPSSPWWRFGIPLGGLLAVILGILAWVGFEVSMEMSSTDEFCTSCHNSPSRWVMDEWHNESAHFNTRSGVVVTCHDCHIPKTFFAKVWVKGTSAASHITTQLTGKYKTKEDFEQHRLALAQQVWDVMEKTDSRECRSCHNVERMDPAQQSETAAQFHEVLADGGVTCIDCHKGIAHHLPGALTQAN
ncbi:NapC/NirT family cytochrome c [Ferrimonas marina]|uniref:Cytochrome c-type protein n=1 Tax=Ferrimonas marina TaxID=299255 RepID=A0A1M5YUS4_9GAMM|nr:NapC/NirT family cytochrome c [Ferrimonas marina]SHI15588.1 periplasmic nitrate reductase subunit NapC [Ferrimonas marina]